MKRAMVLAVAALAWCAVAQAAEKTPIRIALNPSLYVYLPLFLAVDKGYFDEQNLAVDIRKYNGSSVAQMPLIARGDLDIMPVVAGPPLFNARTQGFDIEIVASMAQTHPGWLDGTWLVARKDLWDAGAIRGIKDLKGHAVDAGPEGSPVSFVLNQALIKAGLTRADVKYTARAATPGDLVAAFRNKAQDVASTVEPATTLLEHEGLGVRFASTQDVAPWYQESFFIASAKYLHDNHDAAVRWFKAYLKAVKDIIASDGKWTPEFIDSVVRWSQMPKDVVTDVKGPPWYGTYGRIDRESIARTEEYLLSVGALKDKVVPASFIDETVINEARKQMGIM